MPLRALLSDLEALSKHVRAYADEFGTLLAYLEGGRGGRTHLLWAPYAEALTVLKALNGLAFRGRIILGLDLSGGSPTLEGRRLSGPARPPLAHALSRHRPDRLYLLQEGRGLGVFHPGGKETERGWTGLMEKAPPLILHVQAPTGLVYREERLYPAWEAPPLPLSLAPLEGPYLGGVGWAMGVPTYGLGLVELRLSLEAVLGLG